MMRWGRNSPSTIAPRRIADRAMPISLPGSGMPSSPIIAPIDITSGKVTGRTHKASPTAARMSVFFIVFDLAAWGNGAATYSGLHSLKGGALPLSMAVRPAAVPIGAPT